MKKSMLFCLVGCALFAAGCLLVGCEKDPKAPDPGPGGFSGAVYDLFWVLKADGDLAFTCNQQWGTAMFEPEYPWLEHKAMIRRVTVDGLVRSVGARSLAGCTNLTSVALKSVTLTGDNVILYGDDPRTAFPAEGDTLYIPVGTRAAYEANGWDEVFDNIVEQ